MYRNPRTGYWEEDFRSKGLPRLHVSYGVKRRADAEPASAAVRRVYRERRAELIAKLKAGDVTAHQLAAHIADEKPLGAVGVEALAATAWPTLGVAVADYIDWLAQNERKSRGTAGTAATQLARFVTFAGAETPVDQIDAERVTEYQRALIAEGKLPNTVVSYVWRVSGLFTWLNKRERKEARRAKRPLRLLDVPIDADEVANRQTHRDRYLEEAEAERLLAATPRPLLAAVMLGLLAGLRIDEVLHLRPQYDVDVALGLITIQEQPTWHPKNRKKRVVPIAPQLRPVLEHHIATFASAEWLFPSVVMDGQPLAGSTMWQYFMRIVKDADLIAGRAHPRGVVFHTLRHTFASWLVMKAVDLYTVSQLLGNTLSVVERTYAHLAPDYRQRAVDRLAGIVAIPSLPQELSI